jgi:hypothetical protein
MILPCAGNQHCLVAMRVTNDQSTSASDVQATSETIGQVGVIRRHDWFETVGWTCLGSNPWGVGKLSHIETPWNLTMDGEEPRMHQFHLNWVENWSRNTIPLLDACRRKVSRRSPVALMAVLASVVLLFGEALAQPVVKVSPS